MSAKCPHGLGITQKLDMGLIVYCHEDGTPCKMMNRTDISVDEILDSMNTQDDRVNRLRIIYSDKYRARIYKQMSKATKEVDLLDMLQDFDRIITDGMLDEMYVLFGSVAIDNLVTAGVITEFSANKVKYKLVKGQIARLPMIRLKSGHSSPMATAQMVKNERAMSLKQALEKMQDTELWRKGWKVWVQGQR